jgi:predicted AlkP superfamily pyrophosphatase or phosphodiesterase
MRNHQLRYDYLLPAILLLTVISTGTCLGEATARHVVLISIDGLADFHLDNRDLKLPNIRELIASGVRADHLVTVFPSVTHPSHTSLVTGVTPRRHGVVGNRVRNRETGESFHITDKPRKESVRVPTIFDWAREKGLPTAAFFWPETKDDPSIDFNIPEVFNSDGDGDINAVATSLVKELNSAGIPIELYFKWYPVRYLRPAGDIILARAAAHATQRYKPAVLAIHLQSTDVLQHAYGAADYMSHQALTVTDHCVGIIRDSIEQAGLSDDTALIVTGDHGFVTVEYNLNLWPLFEPLGDKVRLSPQGWALFIEKTEQFTPGSDDALLKEVLDKVKSLEGIQDILTSDQFPGLGLPTYEENVLIPGQYLVIGKVLGRVRKDEPYHGHGYLPEHPSMYVGFVAAGSGIRSGVRVGPVKGIDVSPTIAYLLGLDATGVEGRVLTEILESR